MSSYPDFIKEELDKVLDEFPDIPTRTLAKRVFAQHSKFFESVEQVRSALRRRRGNAGERGRKNASHQRENQEAGWVPQLPPSVSEEYTPYVLEGPVKAAIVTDIHLPYHNVKALERWEADTHDYEPNVILLNGDQMDFYRMSRFEKNPNKRCTAFEIDTAHDFLDWLQHRFPDAKIIWKDGNHDERWRKYMWNHAPEFASLESMSLDNILELDQRGIDYVTDKRIIMLGNLPVLHGHEMQGNGGNVNPARLMGAKLRNSAAQGHVHRTSQYFERNLFGDHMKCWSIGCLCELTPEYARINRWNHGWAFVDVDEDGSYDFNNVVME